MHESTPVERRRDTIFHMCRCIIHIGRSLTAIAIAYFEVSDRSTVRLPWYSDCVVLNTPAPTGSVHLTCHQDFHMVDFLLTFATLVGNMCHSFAIVQAVTFVCLWSVCLSQAKSAVYRVSQTFDPRLMSLDNYSCVHCYSGTQGPCMHIETTLCFAFTDNSQNCGNGLLPCAVKDPGNCAGCRAGTAGPCKHRDTNLCFGFHHQQFANYCESSELLDCSWAGELSLKIGQFVAVPEHQFTQDMHPMWIVQLPDRTKGLFPSCKNHARVCVFKYCHWMLSCSWSSKWWCTHFQHPQQQ